MPLFIDDALKQRARAAAKTHRRMEEDEKRAPALLRPAFQYVRDHLFDTELTIAQLRAACRVRGRSFSFRFAKVAGRKPRKYVEARRLEVARRLLRSSGMSTGQIAELVGYNHRSVFAMAFRRFVGEAPGTFRARQRVEQVVDASGNDLADDSGIVAVDDVLRVLAGHAKAEETKRLIAALDGVHDRTVAASSEQPPVGDSTEEAVARLRAATLCETLMVFEPAQRLIFARAPQFATGAVFEYLRRASRSTGRRDKGEGRALAELAVAASGHRADAVPEDARCAGLQARAWAWLAIVSRQNEDLAAARPALATAQALARAAGQRPLVQGEALHAAADLEIALWEFKKARALQAKAVKQLRRAGHVDSLVRALIQAANIRYYLGDAATAIPIYQEVAPYLPRLDDALLRLVVILNHGCALLLAGRLHEAAPRLDQAEHEAREQESHLALAMIQWKRGVLAWQGGDRAAAEQCLMRAWRAPHLQSSRGHVVLTLELALFFSESEETRRAKGMAEHALARIRSQPGVDSELLAAARILHQLEAKQAEKHLLLERVRSLLFQARRQVDLPARLYTPELSR